MRMLLLLAAVAVALLWLLGGVLSEQCASIGSCRACWKTMPIVVNSTLCAQSPCTAQPADQQNNALVDMYLCACSKAKQADYSDPILNRQIEESLAAFTGYNISASDFCGQPGMVLAKRMYE